MISDKNAIARTFLPFKKSFYPHPVCQSLSGKIIGKDTEKWSDRVIPIKNWQAGRKTEAYKNEEKTDKAFCILFNDSLFIVKAMHWPGL